MRKIFIRKELICPFNYCRILIFMSEEDKSMDIRCESCEYVWNRNSILMIGEEFLFLDENSKEYKEYKLLHTPLCVDDNKERDD